MALDHSQEANNDTEVYLKGRDYRSGEEIDFRKAINGEGSGRVTFSGQSSWTLKVFKSGVTRFSKTDDLYHAPDFNCYEKAFKVTVPKYSNEGDWEDPVTKVKLTLKNCLVVGGIKKCDIDIDNGVGLHWRSEFKPKAIFKK